MAIKKTVAVIGAGERLDPAIVKHLSGGNYRLLLFGHNKQSVHQLLHEIKTENPLADAEYTGCPYDASWEADLIILNEYNKEEITTRIKPVATQKPVIDLTAQTSARQLKKLLPDSKILSVSKAEPVKEIINILKTF